LGLTALSWCLWEKLQYAK